MSQKLFKFSKKIKVLWYNIFICNSSYLKMLCVLKISKLLCQLPYTESYL